jgi:FdhD protein
VSDRPRLGISACLLGEAVRYDGEHKRDAWLVEVLGPQVEWVPVCPEVEAGFGTPREPMQLERTPCGNVALMTVQSRRDLTVPMRQYTARRVVELAEAGLDGYVFKADSPSCDAGRGLFARSLIERLPELPVIDERRLSDPGERQTFVDRVFARHRDDNVARRLITVSHVRGGVRASQPDRVATEEPLEIRLHGRPFAVIMRTPGADRELAAGFLLAERVIRDADDLGTIEHCASPGRDPEKLALHELGADDAFVARPFQGRGIAGNIVNVTLAGDAATTVDRALGERRNVVTNSSCGLCGRQTLESLAVDVPPITGSLTIPSSLVVTLPEKLRASQAVFDETGGLHAAGLFSRDGKLVDVAEDVGRHNAVDKVVGRMLMREQLPLSDHILCVSGRTSFEILQKALFAGIPIVAAVSAPSSLAVDLATAFGITLIGFVRGETFNVYAHEQRVLG